MLIAMLIDPPPAWDVYFTLSTTSFDFDPLNDAPHTYVLSFNQPVKQDWIISPKSDALGEQFFSVALEDKSAGYHLGAADVTYFVKDISGLDPTLIALLNAAGTFLLGLFAILKIVPETWDLYKPKPETKSQSAKKKAK